MTVITGAASCALAPTETATLAQIAIIVSLMLMPLMVPP